MTTNDPAPKPGKPGNSPKQNNPSPARVVARYSGIAVKMIAIILAAVFGGMKLDETLQTAQPYWTLVTTVLG
ncbi:MAG: AtpZ/AtpI family protein, partial [Bacteroidota bacterium]